MTHQGLDYEFQITTTKICFVNGLFSHYKEMTLDIKIPRGMPEGGWGEDHSWNWHIAIVQCTLPGRGGRGSEIPTSHTLYSRFLPSSTVVPTSLYFSVAKNCTIWQNLFPISPGYCPLGYFVSCHLFSRLPKTCSPHFCRVPAPLSPATLPCFLSGFWKASPISSCSMHQFNSRWNLSSAV